ncbi:MAG: efflux transporter outer membrane subunit [Deltaproteobacteria bacterium]|nr:efflux transporter outer membrane subunit [Deltaproteobacteria bacterium]
MTIASVLALLAGGCKMGPDYQRPQLATPEAYRDEAKPTEARSLVDLPWWNVFSDPVLAALVKEGLEQNLDLGIATQRLEVARQANRAAFWALFPTLGVNLGAGRSHGSPSTPTVSPPLDVKGAFTGSVGASWEIDLWGRLRRTLEAAEALESAALEDRRGAQIVVVTSIADAYFQLRTLDAQLESARSAVLSRKGTLALFKERAAGGVGNDLEVARAEANVNDAEALIVDLERGAILTENALSLLLGKPSTAVVRGQKLDDLALPPVVPAGLPSTLLERRPDVRAAECRMAAANARIGVATASFLPRFDLTGFLGFASSDLTKFASGSTDAVYGGSGVLGFTVPVLGGQALQANLAAAKAEHRAAELGWRKTALVAIRDVNDALVELKKAGEMLRVRTAQVAALRRSMTLSEQRYRGGVSNYLEILAAQEQLLVAEMALAGAKGQQFSALVAIYRALGGGWEHLEAPQGAPVAPSTTAN